MEVDTQTGGAGDSVQVVLIGSTGSGKSCTGNTILGNKHFPSDASVKSVTLKYQTAIETIHGRRVTVVDTPGWDCTELHKDEVEAEIQEALKKLRGPYSFLLVIPIGGVESEDIDKIYKLKQVLGPSFLNHTTILFSHSDNLEQKPVQEFLQQGDQQFQDLLKACDHRCHSWNNRNRVLDEDVEKVLRDLKMTEMKDQHQARSSEEPVPKKKIQQKGNGGSTMELDTQTGGAGDSVQVVLIGSTGSGKSCTGNSILGNKHFPSDASAKSITLKCKSATETIHGRQVTVVDTPGWDCTELPKRVVEAGIQEALKNLRGPPSFLLVIPIGGVESEDINKIYRVRQVIGPSFLDHTTILFSHSDNLEQKTFQEFLDEGGAQFQDLLKACGHRCHSWNNRNRELDEDVEKVLTDLKTTEMKDQHQARSSEEPVQKTDTEAMETEDAQNSQKTVRVLFLGMSKTGKTSSIKTLQAKCERTQDEGVYSYSPAGLLLQLIDSPGFDQNLKEIQDLISKSEPHVIVMVMEVGRFSPAVKKTTQDLQDFLGPNATKHTMILFTRKDDLEGASIEKFIEENAELNRTVEANGRRFHALNNRDNSDHIQVEELLQKIANLYEGNKGVTSRRIKQKGNGGKRSRETDSAAVNEQNSRKPIRVLFLGMSRAGKTSSIKTLQAKCERTEDEGVYSYSPAGLLLQLIDSPAFDQNPNMIQDLISKSKPHVIVMVMAVGCYSPALKMIMSDFKNIQKLNSTKCSMILFTGKDRLDGASIEDKIKEDADLNTFVEANGRRFHALNNRDDSDHRQVKELLQKIADICMVSKGWWHKVCPLL